MLVITDYRCFVDPLQDHLLRGRLYTRTALPPAYSSSGTAGRRMQVAPPSSKALHELFLFWSPLSALLLTTEKTSSHESLCREHHWHRLPPLKPPMQSQTPPSPLWCFPPPCSPPPTPMQPLWPLSSLDFLDVLHLQGSSLSGAWSIHSSNIDRAHCHSPIFGDSRRTNHLFYIHTPPGNICTLASRIFHCPFHHLHFPHSVWHQALHSPNLRRYFEIHPRLHWQDHCAA